MKKGYFFRESVLAEESALILALLLSIVPEVAEESPPVCKESTVVFVVESTELSVLVALSLQAANAPIAKTTKSFFIVKYLIC
jgi:hypothetical protein